MFMSYLVAVDCQPERRRTTRLSSRLTREQALKPAEPSIAWPVCCSSLVGSNTWDVPSGLCRSNPAASPGGLLQPLTHVRRKDEAAVGLKECRTVLAPPVGGVGAARGQELDRLVAVHHVPGHGAGLRHRQNLDLLRGPRAGFAGE